MEDTRLSTMDRKTNINKIKTKTKLCLESRKNSNALLEIIAFAEGSDDAVILASIKSLHKIFTRKITTEEMFSADVLDPSDPDLSKEDKYKLWLRDRYKTVQERLLELLFHKSENIQELSLSTLMKFVGGEGQHPLSKIPEKQLHFPAHLFQRILSQLLDDTHNLQTLLSRFQEYVEYDDVRFHTLKGVQEICLQKSSQKVSDVFLNNVFTLLETVTFPEMKDDKLSNLMSVTPDYSHKMLSYIQQKKNFTGAWLAFLQFKLPTSLYRKVLIMLHDKVMPYMSSPIYLSDFLTESYNIGGAISLLALNGVFLLVHKYNLDYPDFYKKLYALFEPTVFHVKYRARFFHLADLFLTSTHLPAYLVAAFIKKLSRLCLSAPVSGLTIAIPFIYNLINRHPNCKQLINKTDDVPGVAEDPYDYDEPDPAKCNALISSLWEVKTLQSHYFPDVAIEARRIDESFPSTEIDLSGLLDTSADSIFDKQRQKKIKSAPLNFDPPKGLLSTKDDKLKLCWTLT